jgi:hypothetical protein
VKKIESEKRASKAREKCEKAREKCEKAREKCAKAREKCAKRGRKEREREGYTQETSWTVSGWMWMWWVVEESEEEMVSACMVGEDGAWVVLVLAVIWSKNIQSSLD